MMVVHAQAVDIPRCFSGYGNATVSQSEPSAKGLVPRLACLHALCCLGYAYLMLLSFIAVMLLFFVVAVIVVIVIAVSPCKLL